jgi:hypothetical protein
MAKNEVSAGLLVNYSYHHHASSWKNEKPSLDRLHQPTGKSALAS